MQSMAIVLAGGSGRRMGLSKPKQYEELNGKPLVCYCLQTFEDSFINGVILVCRPGDEEYCKNEIVEKYSYKKIVKIVPGGKERFDSVYEGLKAAGECDYVFIHDGARPFVSQHVLERCLHYAAKYKAAAAAVRAKDTIKIEDGDGFIDQSPDREMTWQMQTPQVFDYRMILSCYEKLKKDEKRLEEAGVRITDDTMVAKMFAGVDAKLVESEYENIKITTPGDMYIAEALIRMRGK